jgi:hypothetical protein
LINEEELAQRLAQETLALQEGRTVSLLNTTLIPVYTSSAPINYSDIQRAEIEVQQEVLYEWNINEEAIQELFASQYRDTTPVIAEGEQSIASVRVSNHPRWRKQLPDDVGDISVKVID